jgi:hypothetical protein
MEQQFLHHCAERNWECWGTEGGRMQGQQFKKVVPCGLRTKFLWFRRMISINTVLKPSYPSKYHNSWHWGFYPARRFRSIPTLFRTSIGTGFAHCSHHFTSLKLQTLGPRTLASQMSPWTSQRPHSVSHPGFRSRIALRWISGMQPPLVSRPLSHLPHRDSGGAMRAPTSSGMVWYRRPFWLWFQAIQLL